MRRLGGRKGAREGAGIQWPIFPSFCLDEGTERVEGGIVDFDGEEKSVDDFDGKEDSFSVEFDREGNSLVNFDENSLVVEFDGDEKSRACSVAGLG